MEFANRDQLIDSYNDIVLPKKSCACKRHIAKWDAYQRYQLSRKLETVEESVKKGIVPKLKKSGPIPKIELEVG